MAPREEVAPEQRRLSARGAATRLRIVRSASALVRAQGVGGTTMEQVASASATSKSQLYHHFPKKDALVHAVVDFRGHAVLDLHSEVLERARSLRALERWSDLVVGRVASVHGAYGCQLGSIATEIADDDDHARELLQQYFHAWEGLLAGALEAIIERDEISRQADPDVLAQEIMIAMQGGYLLAQVERSETPMRRALDMALDRVRSFRNDPDTSSQ
jgi:TetR/AcrR family transcriptional regulator, transcriptional repressor for nem operon